MFQRKKMTTMSKSLACMAIVLGASTQLAGCPGQNLPPLPVSFDLVLGVEVPAIITATGSADIAIDEVCAIFNAATIEMLVRDAAGDLIGDNLDITAVELASTDIQATEGTFQPFTTAVLDVAVQNSGGDVLLLGMTANNDGLGNMFRLRLDNPVDLLNDLDESECASPELHLSGADVFEGADITFDVRLNLRVHTQIAM